MPVKALTVHNPVLMVDAFHVHRIEVAGYKLFAQTKVFAFAVRPFQYFVPAVGLQNGNAVVAFELPNFVGYFHPLSQ
jgi:hypothetical protein